MLDLTAHRKVPDRLNEVLGEVKSRIGFEVHLPELKRRPPGSATRTNINLSDAAFDQGKYVRKTGKRGSAAHSLDRDTTPIIAGMETRCQAEIIVARSRF